MSGAWARGGASRWRPGGVEPASCCYHWGGPGRARELAPTGWGGGAGRLADVSWATSVANDLRSSCRDTTVEVAASPAATSNDRKTTGEPSTNVFRLRHPDARP